MSANTNTKSKDDKPQEAGERHPLPVGSTIRMYDEFSPLQRGEIRENRDKHVTCMELCKSRKADLMRIMRDGPTLPEDAELVKATAALALWELREQYFLRLMYTNYTL